MKKFFKSKLKSERKNYYKEFFTTLNFIYYMMGRVLRNTNKQLLWKDATIQPGITEDDSNSDVSDDLNIRQIGILDTAHFHESTGFYIKCDEEVPSSIEIKPTLDMGNVSISIPRWKMETSAFSSNHHKILPNEWMKRAISIALVNPKSGKNGKLTNEITEAVEVIRFIHRKDFQKSSSTSSSYFSPLGSRRMIDSNNKSKLVNIFLPHTGELVGWIAYNQPNTLLKGLPVEESGWLINDYISKSTFLTSTHRLPTDLQQSSLEDAILAMQISTSEGFPIAILQAKRGMKQRKTGKVQWTDWKLHFSHSNSHSLPSSSKALILVASLIWVLSYKEESARMRALVVNRRQNSAHF